MPSRGRGWRSEGTEGRAGQRGTGDIGCLGFSERVLPERFFQTLAWRWSGSTQAARARDLQCTGDAKDYCKDLMSWP